MLNDFVKPNTYFVYYMFKDTIHVDDYGSIKETLFKFPNLIKVSKSNYYSDRTVKLRQNIPFWRRCQL